MSSFMFTFPISTAHLVGYVSVIMKVTISRRTGHSTALISLILFQSQLTEMNESMPCSYAFSDCNRRSAGSTHAFTFNAELMLDDPLLQSKSAQTQFSRKGH